MAGEKLAVGDVKIVVAAYAVVLQRIEPAAKLSLDRDGMKSRRAKLGVKSGKLRRPHGLMQHLSDDLLFGKREQRSVFLGGGCFANCLEEDRQQLLLICQCKYRVPIDVFHGQIGA